MPRPTAGVIALSGFFAVGALIAGVTSIALLTPGHGWDWMWRLNPNARTALQAMGYWAAVLMLAVAAACALAAWGLRSLARWGHRLALLLLVVNLIGDTTTAIVRGDPRTLIGLPIGAALIAYLLSAGVRHQFMATEAAV